MHFDRHGLIVATRDETPVGFVHAGFGPSDDGLSLDTSMGTTHILMVDPAERESTLADELLAASEDYLRSRGATVIYAGGINPLNSFYLGLYGGSEIPGVLQSDVVLQAACRSARLPRDRPRAHHAVRPGARPPARVARAAAHQAHDAGRREDRPAAQDLVGSLRVGLAAARLLSARRERPGPRRRLGVVLGHAAAVGLLGHEHRGPVRAVRRRPSCAAAATPATCSARRSASCAAAASRRSKPKRWRSNEAAAAYYTKLGFTEIDHGVVFRKDAALQLQDHAGSVRMTHGLRAVTKREGWLQRLTLQLEADVLRNPVHPADPVDPVNSTLTPAPARRSARRTCRPTIGRRRGSSSSRRASPSRRRGPRPAASPGRSAS